ncbi:MAG: response regulator [Chloroflexota bacterium]
MNTIAEKILLVESDPDISDLVARQALTPLGYQVQIAEDASKAIMLAAQFSPDLVIVNLTLPGLSGKDLLFALNSQGLSIPMIVIAEKGREMDVIQAFRLGAADYLIWPTREAEVVAAVERALKQVREARTRQRLDQKLKITNLELSRRVRELTTIFAVGKAVISITDQRILFDKIVEGTVHVAEADYGWLLLRNDQKKIYYLAAHHNLPDAWAKKMGMPLDDGVSSLVALSGETLSIHDEPLKRFKVASLGGAVIVVPVKVQQEVIGTLAVARKTIQPFDNHMQTLLEAVADYASISLVNAHLFRALRESADLAQKGESQKIEQLESLSQSIHEALEVAGYPLELLHMEKMGKLNEEQTEALESAQAALQRALQLVNPDAPADTKSKKG